MQISTKFTLLHSAILTAVVLLSACGGQSSNTATVTPAAASLASGVTTFNLASPVIPAEVSQQLATPSFHVAPVVLSAPDNVDAFDNAASARRAPAMHVIPQSLRHLSTRGLTPQAIEAAHLGLYVSENAGAILPKATSSAVTTYTPAQIRSAYGLPALPATGVTPTVAQAAAMGAGQTIYIVDAMADPNVIAELSAFNSNFGLPTCTTISLSPTSKLPLAAAPVSGCQVAVVYSSSAGAISASAPAYDSGWATEIALDVQWAHATSPMARIILIEAPSASVNDLLAGVNLANAMGPGAVSMSFGSGEGSWTASADSAFTTANMTYLAATGDNGYGVQWPSVSSHVLAVGGTTLSYSGAGSRSEVAWSGTGGGTSAYTAVPSYQTSSVPGLGSKSFRTVADVAFNADPSSGQYLATMKPGSTSVSWMSAGGTSLATPQWAGIIAIANAQRAVAAKAALGAPHAVLYSQISTVAATYTSTFLDVTLGSDGTCATCAAKSGYDQDTGLGTPNTASLLNVLTGTSAPVAPPVVTAATINGTVGTALSFTASVTAPHAVVYSLTGAPTGMAISSTGAVTWTTPLAGTYAVTVTAKDNTSGLSGSGLYTVIITTPPAPVVSSVSVSGKTGSAFTYTVAVSAVNPLTYTMTGAPSGMSLSATGVISWSAPLAGTYSVTVTAKDTKTALTGKGVLTIVIAAAPAPVVSPESVSGIAGTSLSFNAIVSASNPVTYTLSGAPSGMSINSAGTLIWATPVAGTYAITVTAKDSNTGLSGSGVCTVIINAKGPVITVSGMTGVAGKSMTGSIVIVDKTSTSLSVSITGVPMGVTFTVNGLNITATWANPVAGSYSMKVTATDSAGVSAQTVMPITVTLK